MEMNKNITKWIKITAILCFALWFSGCASKVKRGIAPTPSDDSPLPKFILGAWESIDVQSNKSGSSDIRYQIIFESEFRVYLIVIYPDDRSEGYNFNYEYIDQDTLHVNNIRITGGENWHLEKDNGNLIVTRHFDNSMQTIVLVRVE